MIRQFKMKNALGEEFDLMRKDAFFCDPSGLGIGTETEVLRIGDAFAITEDLEKQPEPSGTIMFAGYSQFEEFRDFVRAGGLVFCYKPLNTWYYVDVTIKVEKTEIDHTTNYLSCTVEMTGTSLWYEAVVYSFTSPEIADEPGKEYDYEYEYVYSGNGTGAIEIYNGKLPSYCKVVINGAAGMKNPSWTLTKDGKVVTTGKLGTNSNPAYLLADYKLVVDSDPSHIEIADYIVSTNEFHTNRYAESDFTTDRFIIVPPGLSILSFHCDTDGLTPSGYVEVKKRV